MQLSVCMHVYGMSVWRKGCQDLWGRGSPRMLSHVLRRIWSDKVAGCRGRRSNEFKNISNAGSLQKQKNQFRQEEMQSLLMLVQRALLQTCMQTYKIIKLCCDKILKCVATCYNYTRESHIQCFCSNRYLQIMWIVGDFSENRNKKSQDRSLTTAT